VGHEGGKRNVFYSLFQLLTRKSIFPALHSDIISLKSGLLHLTGQPWCKKSRSAKVKDGIMKFNERGSTVNRALNGSTYPG